MTDGAQDTTTASTLDAAQALDPRALVALRDNQRQLDQDGVEVGVSRQALDETLAHLAALQRQLDKARAKYDTLWSDYMALEIAITHEIEQLEAAELALSARDAPQAQAVVKPLEWYPDPGAFPSPTWGAQSSFGRFIIEEVSASDTPAYEVRYTPHHLISINDSLEDAKAAAQADFERRILSALTRPSPPTEARPVEALTHRIEHDGFEGTVQGNYVTREGKRGVVLQQIGTRVVHVYGERWLASLDNHKEQRNG